MASGDEGGDDEDLLDDDDREDDADPPEPAASPGRVIDPTVEEMWLAPQAGSAARRGAPRLSTVLLVLAFIALLVLYAFVGHSA